ncbi:MAG: hypothetical protein ACQESK_00915 [Bacteroidota bacterium]
MKANRFFWSKQTVFCLVLLGFFSCKTTHYQVQETEEKPAEYSLKSEFKLKGDGITSELNFYDSELLHISPYVAAVLSRTDTDFVKGYKSEDYEKSYSEAITASLDKAQISISLTDSLSNAKTHFFDEENLKKINGFPYDYYKKDNPELIELSNDTIAFEVEKLPLNKRLELPAEGSFLIPIFSVSENVKNNESYSNLKLEKVFALTIYVYKNGELMFNKTGVLEKEMTLTSDNWSAEFHPFHLERINISDAEMNYLVELILTDYYY